MIIENKNISNDLNDWRTLADAVKTLKTYKKMIDNGYTLSEGYSVNGKSFIENFIKDLGEVSKYILDYFCGKDNTERVEIIIFPEPLNKKDININNFSNYENTSIEFQWNDDDYKLFLDMMQESYCTSGQVIDWHGARIDRSDRDHFAYNFAAGLIAKGYVTRAIIKYNGRRR